MTGALTRGAFGLIVIGDEILVGKRADKHFTYFRSLLAERGLPLGWHWVLPDEPKTIIVHFELSLRLGGPVFVCGGIGATPDDHTRACAAAAVGVRLVRHPGALAAIESRFGVDTYPHRVLMADLPQGAEIIPNPYNRIPGFSIARHFFLPGFPEMAWPMAEWVLDTRFKDSGEGLRERSVWVEGVVESQLLPMLERLDAQFRGVKLFSLPRLGDPPMVEIGFRGRSEVEAAYAELRRLLNVAGMAYREVDDGGVVAAP